jgi:hypothetical protein
MFQSTYSMALATRRELQPTNLEVAGIDSSGTSIGAFWARKSRLRNQAFH